jgi:GNAT superfamily N-acetyltransferase
MNQVFDMSKIAPLFDGCNETIIWSCLQGFHGSAWADDIDSPRSAQIVAGDFCSFAGVPNTALAAHIPSGFSSDMILMVPRDEGWARVIEQVHGPHCERVLRYAIKKEPDIFDKAKLQGFIDEIASRFSLRMIDETLYHKALSEPWSRDLCSQFATYEDYKARGIGVMALDGDVPVAGASSYTVYDKGIEIQVDTRRDYRRQGLATACAAKLILACLERGLYPSWDAHDLRSVALAEKLGYHLDHEYVTYIVENTAKL